MSQKQSILNNQNGNRPPDQPDPEVMPRVRRRTFSATYKVRILAEADACTERGEISALLRREGLYASHLSHWRRQREAGQLQSLRNKPRGRKPSHDLKAVEIARLEQENARLQKQLEQAELIIAAQKKLAEALEQTLTSNGAGNCQITPVNVPPIYGNSVPPVYGNDVPSAACQITPVNVPSNLL